MIYLKIIICPLLFLSCLLAKTPFEYTIGITGGYDNNVMRFSSEEFDQAAMDSELMGGAKTFDSFVYRIGVSGEKVLWKSMKKELSVNGLLNWADFRNNPEREYGSGGVDATFKWGPYQNIKYSLRHLDSFYLRHYINRDISTETLSPCAFTDRNQSIALTHRLSKRYWANLGIGYLQRYYDKPFTEFDLNIHYMKVKLNHRIMKLGSISFQVNRGSAVSKSHFLPDRPSSFNRSYESLEWYCPIKVQKGMPFFSEIGISIRQENRVYAAEDPNDPLHSGRNHMDSKYDLWLKKNLTDNMTVTLSGRYRIRETESAYNWVTDLKSFNQLQFWCKMEMDLIYDRY
jgi:hypothetical protein